MNQERDINGELLKLRREERGWAQSDMATRACMSIKQIRQIEEGGISAFYSESVKLAAAKKVATLLGLSAQEMWVTPVQSVQVAPTEVEQAPVSADETASSVVPSNELGDSVEEPLFKAESSNISLPNSEPVQAGDPPSEDGKPKTSLWLIVGLFAAALAVAAYMRPDEEPVVTEPAPPLQAVPSEAAEPASAASAAQEAASNSASAATTTKSMASAPVGASSASRPVASAGAVTPASAASK
jgi:cytoskeleton protein RodZ